MLKTPTGELGALRTPSFHRAARLFLFMKSLRVVEARILDCLINGDVAVLAGACGAARRGLPKSSLDDDDMPPPAPSAPTRSDPSCSCHDASVGMVPGNLEITTHGLAA